MRNDPYMNRVVIRIPNVLRHHTNGERDVEVSAGTVGDAIHKLFEVYPGLEDSLIPSSGNVFEATNLFLNDEELEADGGLDTKTHDGDQLTILPAMAGGTACV